MVSMRILQGTSVIEAPSDWRESVLAAGRSVVMDVGTGDGRWPYEQARRDPAALYVGLDPDAAAMAEYAYRSARKPARGGVDNVVYVVAALESLPDELVGIATAVRVNFPWAGLLRAVILPEAEALAALRRLLAPGATLEIVFTYDAGHDQAALAGEDAPSLDERYVEAVLLPAYAAAGLPVQAYETLSRDEALAIASTWGRRLLHGRQRTVLRLQALRAEDA